jgi:hydrogenase 3 maturation protease
MLGKGTCLVGMGNYYRSDDAVGLYIIDAVKQRAEEMGMRVINVEEILESYIFTIAEMNCDRVLFIDAVATDSDPGTVIFGKLEDFSDLLSNLSTHHLSLKLCEQILRDHGKEVYLLGIAVQNIEYGTGLTAEVETASELLKSILTRSSEGILN